MPQTTLLAAGAAAATVPGRDAVVKPAGRSETTPATSTAPACVDVFYSSARPEQEAQRQASKAVAAGRLQTGECKEARRTGDKSIWGEQRAITPESGSRSARFVPRSTPEVEDDT